MVCVKRITAVHSQSANHVFDQVVVYVDMACPPGTAGSVLTSEHVGDRRAEVGLARYARGPTADSSSGSAATCVQKSCCGLGIGFHTFLQTTLGEPFRSCANVRSHQN